MNACTNHKLGRLLHDYELGFLNDVVAEEFEMHVLECQHCCDELAAYRSIAATLMHDPAIRKQIADLSSMDSRTAGFWSRVGRSLWPEGTSLLLKPALLYGLIVLLSPLAYLGLDTHETTNNLTFRSPILIEMPRTRGSSSDAKFSRTEDAVLLFEMEVANSQEKCRVRIVNIPEIKDMYEFPDLRPDERGYGRVFILAGTLNPGSYAVVVEYSGGSTSNSVPDTLEFKVL